MLSVSLNVGWGGGVRAYSRLSTSHGHITDYKLDSVVATDSIPQQVSRKETLRPFILTPSHPVGCLTH